MAKFYGPVGYAVTEEVSPGKWVENITERLYYGDKVNDDINISNEISIVADPYAMENFHLMRYVGFMGSKWKVTSVDVQFPRLILSVGGVYNV